MYEESSDIEAWLDSVDSTDDESLSHAWTEVTLKRKGPAKFVKRIFKRLSSRLLCRNWTPPPTIVKSSSRSAPRKPSVEVPAVGRGAS